MVLTVLPTLQVPKETIVYIDRETVVNRDVEVIVEKEKGEEGRSVYTIYIQYMYTRNVAVVIMSHQASQVWRGGCCTNSTYIHIICKH